MALTPAGPRLRDAMEHECSVTGQCAATLLGELAERPGLAPPRRGGLVSNHRPDGHSTAMRSATAPLGPHGAGHRWRASSNS